MSREKIEPHFIISRWCNSAAKRTYDLLGALVLVIVFLPVMAVAAVAVKLTSPGPIFFRQKRPGKNGKEFTILKFRTMIAKPQGPVLTRAADPRVTWFGRHMRKWKLDELPQLFNVIRGEMSFVGPRPQPTKLWKQPSIQDEVAVVLSVRPGITSQATLNFRNEEELLAPLSPEEVEEVYMKHLMPLKLKMELDYLRSGSFSSDLGILFRTMFRIVNRQQEYNDEVIRRCLPPTFQSQADLPVNKTSERYEAASHGD